MNASNGALVATLSTDDRATYDRLAPQIRAFKVGHGKPRSRGDRDELFGGFGASWRGAFVGGELLVRAVTAGPGGGAAAGQLPRLPPHAAGVRDVEGPVMLRHLVTEHPYDLSYYGAGYSRRRVRGKTNSHTVRNPS